MTRLLSIIIAGMIAMRSVAAEPRAQTVPRRYDPLARPTIGSPFVDVPVGWTEDAAQASALLNKLVGLRHFGNADAILETSVYVAPRPGVVLFITHASSAVATDRETAARVEVDQLHRTSQRASFAGSGISEDGWQERVDVARQQIEASLTWRDRENHTIDISRLVIAGDADRLVSVTGECIAREDAEVALTKACTAALATLDPRVDRRVPLALAPTGAELPAPAETVPPAAGHLVGGAPSMQDGSRAVLPPMTISHEAPPPDRRPVYIGGGVVVLAALFWWNRRRRERFEREDAPKESDDR